MTNKLSYDLLYTGKVREVFDIGYNLLAIRSSNCQSAFDRQICCIPEKGNILTDISAMWFQKTKSIIDNHYLWHNDNIMIVKKCRPILIEFVVRGYITGNTSTSLWTHYERGERIYCGILFPDGLKKNQKLEKSIIAPTTKGKVDELISCEEIINRGLLKAEDLEYIKKKALELFEYGQKYVVERGLILVDTKYEFGFDITNGQIILIDEIHTCDSSRYWFLETYEEKFSQGLSPLSFDKDMIRNWIIERCDPYKDEIPKVPSEEIEKVMETYIKFYGIIMDKKYEKKVSIMEFEKLVEFYFENMHRRIMPMVVILVGSEKDKNGSIKFKKN